MAGGEVLSAERGQDARGQRAPAKAAFPMVWSWGALGVGAFFLFGCGSGKSATGSSQGGVSNACAAGNTSTCGSGLVCERYGGPACADPNWAEWPMPNAQIEVEAGAPNLESYTDNGNGTVTDNVTGLVWQQLPPSTNLTQSESLAYCAQLMLGGYADWRLPSVIELVSIVDTGAYNPSINSTFFPGTPAVGFYWSSTPFSGDAGDASNAWGVYFNNGYSDNNNVLTPYSVRCVR